MNIPLTKSRRRKLPSNYVLNGKSFDVKHLIYHCDSLERGKVIVYIDHDLDLEWECDDKAEELNSGEPRTTVLRKTLNHVAALEPAVHSWPRDLKLTAKRLMGEAIASALCGDEEASETAFQNAVGFVNAKSSQVSRYWILRGCMVGGCIAALLGAAEVFFRVPIRSAIGVSAFQISLSFWAGCVGALLFVTLRLTQTRFARLTALSPRTIEAGDIAIVITTLRRIQGALRCFDGALLE